MNVQQAVVHFGSQHKLAEFLSVTDAAISMWNKRGNIPPLQQLKLEIMTNGALKADSKIMA